MSSFEDLGDQGYSFDSELASGLNLGYRAMPISSRLDLVPNPDLADRFAGLTEEEHGMAQLAYNIFHQPFAELGGSLTHVNRDNHDGMYTPEQAVELVGIEGLAKAFKLFRGLAGEEEYGGMELEVSDDTKQTLLPEYFALTAAGKVIINRWVSGSHEIHDIKEHVMGAVLACSEVSQVLVAAGAAAPELKNREKEVNAGNDIDFSYSYIKGIWKSPGSPDREAGYLTERIRRLQTLPGMEPFTRISAGTIAYLQTETIKRWQREPLFVVPEAAQRAAGFMLTPQALGVPLAL